MEALSDVVHGKSVTLVGSAPGGTIQGLDSDLLVCVNAAALGLGGQTVPDITIFNTAFANLEHLDYGRQTRARLGELRTRLLLIIDLEISEEPLESMFGPVQRQETRRLGLDQRCAFLERFTGKSLSGRSGPDHVPSTGFFSCMLLLASGARRIHMRGFSFGGGLSYTRSDHPRVHLDRDLETMALLLDRAHPVDFEPSLIEQFHSLGGPKPPTGGC